MAENMATRGPASLNYSIWDSTNRNITPRASALLDAARAAGPSVGVARIEFKAGKGGGHLSHAGGSQFDIIGYQADGSLWTPAQRAAVAAGARQAGADRFGFYPMGGAAHAGQGVLHIGYSGRGFDPYVWGANGLVRGADAQKFTDPAEKGFVQAFNTGTAFDASQYVATKAGLPQATPTPDDIATRPFPVAAAAAPAISATPAEINRMTGVVLAEARGEGPDGMAGVAYVIKNRAALEGGSVSAGLKSKLGPIAAPMVGGYSAAQFVQAQQIVKGVLDGSIPDKTGGATYFANPKKSEPAALRQITAVAEPTATIGNHVFYGTPGKVAAATAAPAPDTNALAWADAIRGQPSVAPAAQEAEATRAIAVGDEPTPPVEAWNKLVTNVTGITPARSMAVDPPYVPSMQLGYTNADKAGIAGSLGYVPPAAKNSGNATTGQYYPEFNETTGVGAGRMPQFYGGEGATQPQIDWSGGVTHVSGGPLDVPSSIIPSPAEQPTKYTPTRIETTAPTKDPLETVNDVTTARQNFNMATAAPPTVTEGSKYFEAQPVSSIDYALGRPDSVDIGPGLSIPPAEAPVTEVAPPQKSMASTPPPQTFDMSPTRQPNRLNKVLGMPGMQSYSGVSPIAQSVLAAAHAAGLTVSPGTPAGYHAPNFSTGSGGANFAYKPNLDANGNPTGTGTYINSYGQTMTY